MYSSSSPILDAEQRARRYWYADGLHTLVVGLGLAIFGFGLLPRQPHETPLSVVASFAALGLYMTVRLKHSEIIDWLKARVTYPRTGYVCPPITFQDTTLPLTLGLSGQGSNATLSEEGQRIQEERRRRRMFTLALVVLGEAGVLFVDNRWAFTAWGIAITAALWIVRKDYRLSPIVLLGCPLLGLYTTLFVASRGDRSAYSLVGLGVLFALDGAFALTRYIMHNPAPKVPEA